MRLPGAGGGLDLALHDVSAERLAYAERLASRIVGADRRGGDRDRVADRRAALDGAGYVINEIQVGGYDATRLDFDIPASYGVRQTIADTLGIGGIFRGLRTIPVVTASPRTCPAVSGCLPAELHQPDGDAPLGGVRGHRRSATSSGCAIRSGTRTRSSAGLVGAGPGRGDFVTAGFNHQAFVLRFEHGPVAVPAAAEIIDASPELQRRVRVEMFRRFGYFPTESSEHSAEYVPWFMRHDDQVERFRIFVGDYLARSEENLRELED